MVIHSHHHLTRKYRITGAKYSAQLKADSSFVQSSPLAHFTRAFLLRDSDA